MMTIAGSWWWVVWAVLSLAMFGAWFLAGQARAGARRAREWVADRLQGRVDPPWWWKPWLYRWRWWPRAREHRIPPGIDADCWYDTHEDCPGCACACHEDALEELPPERSREELGFTGPRPLMGPAERAFWSELEEFGPHGMLRPERERRAPWWEAEHRAAYESLGFDYPSGLMARVRELAP